jgi:hypothetical protein
VIATRAFALSCVVLVAAQTLHLQAQGEGFAPLSLIDVPFISQSEALCGGAAAAMVLRYWGERGVSAEAFAHLVDRSAAGIRTDALVADLRRRGWTANGMEGDVAAIQTELSRGRPVMTLIEDRPSTFHYVVIVAWHERGIVLHDPARAPFRVMSTGEFTRRWRAARRWMAIVVPGESHQPPVGRVLSDPPSSRVQPASAEASAVRRSLGEGGKDPAYATTGSLTRPETNACEQAVAQGIRHAQSNDLEAAERVFAEAVACPGATRELAGVRVLQKRWVEASDLASAAVAADQGDDYAWKVLATSRFVQNDRLGALAAWNQTGEPRLDLVRIDGLTRTRHRPVERLLDIAPGELLTASRFTRAKRQLAELPSASSTRLEYVPVSAGLAELRASVADRPLVPTGRLALAAAGLAAAATREVRLTTGSLVGSGETISAAWRFWPHRPRVAGGMRAPAPWGGSSSIQVFSERQPFTVVDLPRAERVGARLDVSDWMTGRLRWDVSGGVDEWAGEALRGSIGGDARWASFDDRVVAAAGVQAWLGHAGFATIDAGVRGRSSREAGSDRLRALRSGESAEALAEAERTRPTLRGITVVGSANVQIATNTTPLDLWWAGDTGHARAALLRAHPLLDQGRLRVERLGRAVVHASLEAQRWWMVGGPASAAAAVFGDVARTARRRDGPALGDVDVGVGARVAVAGMPGVFRVDVAKGLRDGAAAVSVAYEP